MSESDKPVGFEECWRVNVRRSVRPKSGGSSSSVRGGSRERSEDPALSASSSAQPVSRAISDADKARLGRVVRGAPEVVVKVTRPGRVGKDGKAISVSQRTEAVRVAAHVDYISRNGQLDLETSDGDVICDKSGMDGLTSEWLLRHDEARYNGDASDRTRITTSLVFSMPADVCGEHVQDAVRSLAEAEFGGRYDYVMALHTDTDHPHVHLTVCTVGYDGVKLNVRKADLQHLREQFAQRLRHRGIEAEATPRHARGVTRKGDRIAVRKVRDRGHGVHTDQAKRTEVERELRAHGGRLPDYPWDHALMSRRNRVIGTYMKAAKALAQSDDPADRELARDTERYASGLTGLMTERAQIASETRRMRSPGASVAQSRKGLQDRNQGREAGGKQPQRSGKGRRDRKR